MFGFGKKKDPRVEFVRKILADALLERGSTRCKAMHYNIWTAVCADLPKEFKEDDIEKVMRTLGEEMSGEKH